MVRAAFVGFGEVNTPSEIILKKCTDAEAALKAEGLDLVSVYPVTDDYEEKDIKKAIARLEGEQFDVLVVCIAGWIPTHAVVKITEHFRHKPMVLWGLCGWVEGDRLVTTADQAGTSAIRKTFRDLGYNFKFVYVKYKEGKELRHSGSGCGKAPSRTLWYGGLSRYEPLRHTG